jgi:tetratricopeptide (TPR) repeat protein
MPSHIYLRTGKYEQGVAVNEAAVNSYRKLIPLYAPVTANDFLYIIHNLHMQTNNAMLAVRSGYSSQAAKETVKSIPRDYLSLPGPLGNYVQYIYMTPLLVDTRFGNWDNLLAMPKPDAGQIYSNLLYHFGRGMAFSARAKQDDARTELEKVRELMKDSSLAVPLSPFSAAIEGAIIAENILAGTIALKDKSFTDAIAFFQRAVQTEEKMVYNEPRDWLLNPKQYLGNAFLKAGMTKEAKEVLSKDLQNNRENGWALFGICQALTAEKKKTEANRMLLRFKKATPRSDIKLYGPVF